MSLQEELRAIVDDKKQRRAEQAKLDKLSYEAGRVKRITEDFVGDVRDAAHRNETRFVVLEENFVPYKHLMVKSSKSESGFEPLSLEQLPEESTPRKVAEYIRSKEMPVVIEFVRGESGFNHDWCLSISTYW